MTLKSSFSNRRVAHLLVAVAAVICSPLGAQENGLFPAPGQPARVLTGPDAEALYLHMSAGDPRIDRPPASYLYRKQGEVLVRMDGFLLDDSPGNPALPYQVYRVALPPDADPGTLALEITHLEERRLPEAVRIVPAPPFLHDQKPDPEGPGEEELESEDPEWGFGKNIVDGHNILVYERDAPYPAAYAGVVSAGQMRKWQIASVIFHPLRYNPVHNEVYVATRLAVKVTYERDPAYLDDRTARLLRDDAFDGLARKLTLNYDQARRWYDRMLIAAREREGLVRTEEDELSGNPGYAIITTEETFEQSTESEELWFDDFCFHKQDLGYSVIVVTQNKTRTVTLVDDSYTFSESPDDGYENVTYEDPPHQRPQKIRKWLQDNYLDLGIRYVLLVGDPDPDNAVEDDHVGDIPMVMAWREPGREHPTDLYYSDLSDGTNWNLDGDEYIGEFAPHGEEWILLPDGVAEEEFIVCWEGNMEVAGPEATVTFNLITDGHTKIWLDYDDPPDGFDESDLVLNDTDEHKPLKTVLSLPDPAAASNPIRSYPIRIEYTQSDGEAYVEWSKPTTETLYATVAFKTAADLNGLDAEYFNTDTCAGEPVISQVDEKARWWYLHEGDRGAGGVDFFPEVFVGRIPFYDEDPDDGDDLPDVEILNAILGKIIAYEQADGVEEAWRRRILCSTPHMYDYDDVPGYETADYLGCETLRNEVATPSIWEWYRIHDEDYDVDAEVQDGCYYDKTVAGWNDGEGRGLVMWRTHGRAYRATNVLRAQDCNDLDDGKPSFVIQATCGNGWPEVRDHSWPYPLGYELLKQGAVATISATRTSGGATFIPEASFLHLKANEYLLFDLAKGILENVPVGETLAEVRSYDAVEGDWWQNILNYNLYGDPALSLFGGEPRANNDVVFLLDGSGSMLSEGKWAAAKDAAVLFYELMAELRHPAHHDRYSAVVFRCIDGEDACVALSDGLEDVTEPLTVGDFDDYTPLDSYYTPIGGGLELAISKLDLDSPESFYSQKFIVLLSDGKHNCGLDPLDDVELPDEVVIHAVGLGEDSIQPDTIASIASDSYGDFRISPSPREVVDFFLQILTSTSWKLQDVPVTVTDEATVPIDQQQAVFVAVWDDPDMAVSFDLDPPGAGADITPSNLEGYPPMECTHHAADPGETTHAFYACDGIPDELLGDWEFVNLNDDGVPVTLEQVLLKVIEDPRVIAEFDVAAADHVTGQPLVLSARITEDGRPLTGLTEVYAELVRSPAVAVGSLMAKNDPGPGYPPAPPQGVDRTPWNHYLHGVMERLGIESLSTTDVDRIAFNDDGQGADARAGDGIYTGLFTDTHYEGSYTFRFRSRGANRAGVVFERGQTLSAHVRFAASAAKTDVETVSLEADRRKKTVTATVRITPRDAFGEYLGPFRGDRIRAWSSKGSLQPGLADAKDGSYDLTLVYPRGTSPRISVAVGDDLVVDREPVRGGAVGRGFSLHLGRTVPEGTFNRSHDPGYSLALDFELPVNPRLSAVAVAGYHQFAGVAGTRDTHWLSFSGNLKLELTPAHPWRLFISGGLGAYVPEKGSTRPGVNLGVGYELSPRSDLDLELAVDYHRVFTSGPDVEFFVPRFGLVLHF